MLRSILSVVAGFLTMTVIVMVGTMALMAGMVPGGMKAMRDRMRKAGGAGGAGAMPTPTPRYLAANIALSLLAAIAGGWVTARIAPTSPMSYVGLLCAVVLVMGVLSARMPGSEAQPGWYRAGIPVVGVVGAVMGGLLRSGVG
ncbi:MAG: hypothetical protein JWO05_2539 [Gemmatimonadetes bacterium]|nr:hypothetical protein [Gemmatimonadota bacterium]